MGETSRASDSVPGDKSIYNKLGPNIPSDTMETTKDMLFDSQIEDEDLPDKKREKIGLIDKNAQQSHNYTERSYPKNQKNFTRQL